VAIATIERVSATALVEPWKLALPNAYTSLSWVVAAAAGCADSAVATAPVETINAVLATARKKREDRRICRRLVGATPDLRAGHR
jgi:hypothetical protein